MVTTLLVANLLLQISAGVPDCIHANSGGYVYPKPAVQLTEGISAYSVSPSITTYTQGNAIKYSSLEESAYASVTPGPIIKQIGYSAPIVPKIPILPTAPVITKSYLPSPTPVITKSYLPPVAPVAPVATVASLPPIASYAPIATVAPVITKSYLPPPPHVNQLAFTAPLSKVATYTPTSNIYSIPAVKSLAYPKISTGYQATSVA